jgi:short-subunit dehydrogenase
VTGASSGIGVDFARELARRECNVILVARREERLKEVQAELAASFGVEAHYQTADLADEQARLALYQSIDQSGRTVDVLINNAGFGLFGMSWEIPWEQERQMLNVDIMAMAHLTKLYLTDMLARDRGYILQVASYGAYQPSPTYASYSAAKSFVLNYGEALSYELRHSNVGVTVVSPGIVATEFHDVAGQRKNRYQRLTQMAPADVARIAVDAMLKRKASVIPGKLNAAMVWSNRLIPRRMSASTVHRLMTMD